MNFVSCPFEFTVWHLGRVWFLICLQDFSQSRCAFLLHVSVFEGYKASMVIINYEIFT